MKRVLLLFVAASFAIGGVNLSHANASDFDGDIAAAISDDSEISIQAIQRLRAEGRTAFAKLLTMKNELADKPAAERARFDRVIDEVGGARYSSVSGLYWHTDLDKALAEAKATGKPILSLRMMGDLREEYSCANSRFFRTTLYANEEISKVLREQYVLHWKSVRPVPKVTIDFGDGRKLERTLTGNSIHYVLLSDGTILDALPGLYSPQEFLAWIQESQTVANAFVQFARPKESVLGDLQQYHTRKASNITRVWQRELAAIETAQQEAAAQNAEAKPGNPPAALAAERAIPKMILEIPIIANVVKDARALEAKTPAKDWELIAERHLDTVKLDQRSLDLIRAENPVIPQNGQPAADDEAAFQRLVKAFEKAIAQDTVRNEYLLHFKIHEWFANGTAPADLEKFNEQVYAELFLTPRQDPWIGLVPPDAYTGLKNGGVVLPK